METPRKIKATKEKKVKRGKIDLPKQIDAEKEIILGIVCVVK